LERELESQRIARRLADMSHEHRLARFKKIALGYVDGDYARVERIIAHQRRVSERHRKANGKYFAPATPSTHWRHFGFHSGAARKKLEHTLESYMKSVDQHLRRFLEGLAATIDPRFQVLKSEMEKMDKLKKEERKRRNGRDIHAAAAIGGTKVVVSRGEALGRKWRFVWTTTEPEIVQQTIAQATMVVPASGNGPSVEHEPTKADNTSDVQMDTEADVCQPSTELPATPSDSPSTSTDAAVPSPPSPPPHPPSPSPPAAPPSPPPVTSPSGRPIRRSATRARNPLGGVRVGLRRLLESDDDEDEGEFVHSSDDEDLQAILRASRIEAMNAERARKGITSDNKIADTNPNPNLNPELATSDQVNDHVEAPTALPEPEMGAESTAMLTDGSVESRSTTTPIKRGRGRPKGSRGRGSASAATNAVRVPGRGRGRPRGSTGRGRGSANASASASVRGRGGRGRGRGRPPKYFKHDAGEDDDDDDSEYQDEDTSAAAGWGSAAAGWGVEEDEDDDEYHVLDDFDADDIDGMDVDSQRSTPNGRQAQYYEDDDSDDMHDGDDASSISSSSDDDDDESIEFLVKWQKLPYDACTWETRRSLRKLDHMRRTHAQLEQLIKNMDLPNIDPQLEWNKHVALTSIFTLPFQPLSQTLFVSNLYLKYMNLPIILDDEAHLAAIGAEQARRREEEADRDRGTGSMTNHEQSGSVYRMPLHPSVPLSQVRTTSSSGNGASLSTEGGECISALHDYLRRHSSKTLHSAIVYPTSKSSASTSHSFTMKEAAVTAEMRFGKNQDLALRYYQVDGINWLALNWSMGRNAILADEMGLGKTVQTSTLMNYMVTRQHLSNPILVVTPLSTVSFWQREVERFTSLYAIVYRGGPDSRKMMREYEWKWPSISDMDALESMRMEEGVDSNTDLLPQEKLSGVASSRLVRRTFKFNVMITSYEYIINDFAWLSRIPFAALIIDEAQRLKNSSSKLFERLSLFKIPRKLLLSGTPLQNAMGELWSLLHFIEPDVFPDRDQFLNEFGDMRSVEQVTKLYHSLRPYVLRRLKSDVEKSLPAKEEILVEIELTRVQKKYYRAVYERNFKFLTNESSSSGRHTNSLINVAMQLRKVCQHPYLMEGCEQNELAALSATLPAGSRGSRTLTQDAIMEKLVSCSGKFILLDKLLPKLKHEGHRVLIFSQMTRLLDILQDYLHYRRYKHERLDGNVGTAERQVAIDRFSAPNSDRFVFLLSTKAGGLGLTLTAADRVIIFDSDWNLQNDLQAIDRAHRIGQTKDVTIYRLLTKGTYEMEMFRRACLKLTLDKVVMASLAQEVSDGATAALQQRVEASGATGSKKKKGKLTSTGGEDEDLAATANNVPFDKAEVEDMLRHGAYNIFAQESEHDVSALQFAEEDISRILKRSQHVKYATDQATGAPTGAAVVDAEASASPPPTDGADATSASPSPSPSAPKSTSTFSKASFVSKDGGEELDLSDPNFWQKLGLQDRSKEAETKGKSFAEDFFGAGAANMTKDRKRARKPALVYRGDGTADGMWDDMDEDGGDGNKYPSMLDDGGQPGVGRCQVCLGSTRSADSECVVICDRCEEEVHLTCAGIRSSFPPDEWLCSICSHTRGRRRKKQDYTMMMDEEGDEEYRPTTGTDAWSRKHLGTYGDAAASMGIKQPTASRTYSVGESSPSATANATPSQPEEPADLTLIAYTNLHAQYTRLISTYRALYPGKSDEQHEEAARTTWKRVFMCEPPTEEVLQQLREKGTQSVLDEQMKEEQNDAAQTATSTTSPTAPTDPTPSACVPSPTQQTPSDPAPTPADPSIQQTSTTTTSTDAFSALASTAAASPPAPVDQLRCHGPTCNKVDDANALQFNLCGACMSVRYCSKECQIADWKFGHRFHCKPFAVKKEQQ